MFCNRLSQVLLQHNDQLELKLHLMFKSVGLVLSHPKQELFITLVITKGIFVVLFFMKTV